MPQRDDDRRAIDSAESTLAHDIEKTWRSWKAFVAEKLDELAAQQADESPEADLTGGGRPASRRAKLDAATRQQFGAVLEARRQQAQAKGERDARAQGQPAPDADQIYAGLLKHLAAELDGIVHRSGMALVWYKDALIKFDAAALGAGTTNADYLALGAGKGPTKQQAAFLLGLIAVMSVIAVFMVRWAFGTPADSIQAASSARVGQASTPLWAVASAAIGDQPVPASMSGAYYPPVLCVEAPAARLATPGATITLSGTQAIRRYQMQAKTANTDDLLLADCATSPPVLAGSALLVETRTRIMLAGQTVRSLAVRGADLDPQTIPADQMEVTLDVAIPEAAGTLILADGRRWSATRSEQAGGGTRLVYLVPLALAAQPAGWELARGDQLPELLALDLPAPISRAALLRRVLDVQARQPSVAMRDGAPELSLTLSLTLAPDASPLALLPGDLVVLSNGVPASAHWDVPQLLPGQPSPVTLRVPLRSHDTLEFALAAWHVRINIE